ncbi:hypothetical protein A2630_00565 [Candidatus Woesebacteria bacterium RIFCSPHIGHO2_01_FULL_44_10]|uniref:Peptidase MA-like domain-containing protein n=1 Tax=Candidatus Woesebacteria bacterium RIFCSPLOWO2_01_FULL_44_14 TaxID=1802525 RepID=A0A1F8C3N1_9BACT|nr:MAG: hypothetical protein A2630_00565 [Candidatus Woesebacteria bacterium RIFCSPHIGHO2_01_FULL_44_10]OGM54382.1 MAG: hypothetical protein A3F62_01360 [Candidatus Woesebacteria bacterium RIFCSPHIGHO2_12_FULL_44_11]OGM70285.1 MAG: hypothetical protein A2975_04410 [Candidatus Woesebacteria bacterium RIFCSPLOWO2_01_FULL_44_14]
MKLSVELHSLESKDSLTLLKAIYKSLDDFKSVTKVDLDNIQITCTNSHRQMEQILGYKRPMWGVSTIKKGKIFLYNPRLWNKKQTGHTPGDVVASITHQLVHLYFEQEKIKSPVWFEEGYATYVSDRQNEKFRKNELKKLVKKYGVCDYNSLKVSFAKLSVPALYYQSSYGFMFYLVKLQKENSLNKLTDKLKNGENFENSFINIYGRSAKDIWEEFNNKLIK